MRAIGAAVLLLALLVGCRSPAPLKGAARAAEERAVYAAVLRELVLPSRGSPPGVAALPTSPRVVVVDETEPVGRFHVAGTTGALAQLRDSAPGLPRGALRDYRGRAAARAAIDSLAGLGAPYALVPDATLRRFYRPDSGRADPTAGWAAFYRSYPAAEGLVRFSRVGFDARGRWAVVYVAHSYGELGAWSGLVALSRRDAAAPWRVRARTVILVS